MGRRETVRKSHLEDDEKGKYKQVSGVIDYNEEGYGHTDVTIFYNDDGSIDEDATYTDEYNKKNGLGKYRKSNTVTQENKRERRSSNDSTRNNSRTSSSSSSSSSSSEGLGYCAKFCLTIIPILPIWWLIKLPFTMGSAIIQIVWSIITWPIRIICYCCYDSKSIIPDDISGWPKYDF